MLEDCLDEQTRAEDILLGSLGLGEDAHILEISYTEDSYSGIAVWSDGEKFEFSSEDELTDLERWALKTFKPNSNRK